MIQIQRTAQRGFTLIELAMIIVILGVLAAIALPKYIKLSKETQQAATEAMAGAISSASAANFAAKKVGNPSALTIAGSDVCTTQILGPLLQGGLPRSNSNLFSIIGGTQGDGDCTTSDFTRCRVFEATKATTAFFTVYCAR